MAAVNLPNLGNRCGNFAPLYGRSGCEIVQATKPHAYFQWLLFLDSQGEDKLSVYFR
jgi:hypothetical protein